MILNYDNDTRSFSIQEDRIYSNSKGDHLIIIAFPDPIDINSASDLVLKAINQVADEIKSDKSEEVREHAKRLKNLKLSDIKSSLIYVPRKDKLNYVTYQVKLNSKLASFGWNYEFLFGYDYVDECWVLADINEV